MVSSSVSNEDLFTVAPGERQSESPSPAPRKDPFDGKMMHVYEILLSQVPKERKIKLYAGILQVIDHYLHDNES